MSEWATPSDNGVPIPPAPAVVSDLEAASPGRRSPQVRRAQLLGSRRPDLLPKQPADTP